jgi:hypothetical protein
LAITTTSLDVSTAADCQNARRDAEGRTSYTADMDKLGCHINPGTRSMDSEPSVSSFEDTRVEKAGKQRFRTPELRLDPRLILRRSLRQLRLQKDLPNASIPPELSSQ